MTGRISDLRRTAFVSGASSGLGRAFTEMLLAEGVRVWGTSRDTTRLASVAADHPGAFTAVALDLSDPEGAIRAFQEASKAAGGTIDLLVNNAGFGVFAEFAGVESSVWRSQLDGMLGTVLALSHEAYASMRRQGRGCIVHVSSIAAEFPLPYMSGYNVAKAGLSALSESLMFESRGTAVRMVDFRPGDYRTEFNTAMQNDSKTEGTRRAWGALEAVFAASPLPEKAARDLRAAILADRSGVVRSGSFFQASLAPLLARLFPASWVRWGTARYFGG